MIGTQIDPDIGTDEWRKGIARGAIAFRRLLEEETIRSAGLAVDAGGAAYSPEAFCHAAESSGHRARIHELELEIFKW